MRTGKYRFGFDIGALILFIVIMIPNIIWALLPAPNDLLRNDSVTETMDRVASVFQTLFVAALCFIRYIGEREVRCRKILLTLTTIFTVLYLGAWIMYYCGVANATVILGLCVFPCAAFLCYAAAKQNWVATVPLLGFTFCHVAYGIINFI